MATLAEIKARVADEIFRPGEFEAQIATSIGVAIRYYETTRFWFNQGTQTAAIVAGNGFVALPDGTQQVDRVFVGTRELCARQPEDIQAWISAGPSDGEPSDYARLGETLRLYRTPITSDTATIFGFFNLAPLTDDGSNGWTTHGQDVLVARTKLIMCRGYTLDATRAQIATFELTGDPAVRGDRGFEGALKRKNDAILSSGVVRSYY